VSMVDRLVLVRHAMPVVDSAVPPAQWQLGPGGRAAARALAAYLPRDAHYVSSPEPKARQTLEALAEQVAVDDGLAEVRRPHTWEDDYRSRARAYVEGVVLPGWEPHEEVVERFAAAVARHASVAAAQHKPLVVGTHGLAPTLWLASRYRLEPSPAEFWAGLRFPDLIEVTDTVRTWPPRSSS
jgi:2,3-bisphosphoglycerate-dependent phosphoglycerate mutase